jgi:hypothetical protein
MPQLVERNQVGKREDVADLIANIDSTETPLVSMIPKGRKPTNTLFEWQTDKFREPNTDGVPDGQDVKNVNNQSEDRTMLQGRLQVFRESFGVGFVAETVSNVAGLSRGELAEQGVKALVTLKRGIERQIGGDSESRADDGTNGSKTRGFGKWTQSTAQSDLPVDSRYLTPAASIYSGALSSLSEDSLSGLLNSIAKQYKSRKRLVLVAGIALKKQISDMAKFQPGVSSTVAALRCFEQDAKARMIHATVDFYSGDGAELEILTHFHLAGGAGDTASDNRGYIFDPSILELRFAAEPEVKKLEDKGGGPRGYCQAIVGLCVKNPLGLGKIAAT